MLINGTLVETNSRVSFVTLNSLDIQTYVGTVVALGSYAISNVANNDVDNYHLQVLKTNATVDPDPQNQEYIILKLEDGTLFAVARDWVSPATFTVLDQSVDFYIVVRSISDQSVKTNILDMLNAAGHNASEYLI